MHVQVTPTSVNVQGVLVVAERGSTHFTVVESNGGKSNATFSWEVTALRKGPTHDALPSFEKFHKNFLDKKENGEEVKAKIKGQKKKRAA